MTDERLKYILDQEVYKDKSEFRKGLKSPWMQDGLLIATNAYTMLCLEERERFAELYTDNNENHPDVTKVINFQHPALSTHYINVNEFDRVEFQGSINGAIISKDVAKQIAHILRLFGIENALFRFEKGKIIFDIHDRNNIEGFLFCIYAVETIEPVKLSCHSIKDTIILEGTECNDEKGEAYYQKCVEEERKAEEEYNKPNFNEFEITLQKLSTICVRARTLEEAEKIALNNYDDNDFEDSDVSVDSYTTSCRVFACDYYEHYYDENGEQDWDDDEEEE